MVISISIMTQGLLPQCIGHALQALLDTSCNAALRGALEYGVCSFKLVRHIMMGSFCWLHCQLLPAGVPLT